MSYKFNPFTGNFDKSGMANNEIVKASWHPTNTDWKVFPVKFGDFASKADDDRVNNTLLPMVYAKTGSSTIAQSSTTYAKKIGVDTFTSGTTANNLVGVEMEASANPMRFGDARLVVGAQIKLLSVPDTNRDLFAFGLGDNINAYSTKNAFWYFDKNSSTTKWQAYSRGSSANTQVTTLDIDTQWINLEIDIPADMSEIRYYANGTLIYTESTAANIPSAGDSCNFQVSYRQIDGTAHSFEVHQMWLAYKLSSADGSFNFDLS